uniref:Related to metallophosphoesterase domain-containing protein 2 n=1 Tax=Ramularia collo-cygni TaxID=112498 RepID=A0A2D3UWJ8_9PEZI
MVVPTKFLVLSDTHNFEYDAAEKYPLCQEMPKVDVVLHCGDLTQVGGTSAYKKALKMLGKLDAELKLVIAGNHDISLDGEYWRTHLEDDDEPEEHDEAVGIMTGTLAQAANVTYLVEGLYVFTLQSGASFKIFVSPYQPECGDWAFGYKRDEDRWSIPSSADIVMTHGPQQGILDFAHDQHLGCRKLREVIEVTRPLMHCFGHIHEGYGAEVKKWDDEVRKEGDGMCQVAFSQAGTDLECQQASIVKGKSTLMVNAAIMNESNKPENAPWLVELPLNDMR